MGRTKLEVKKVGIKVRIPAQLHAKVALLLFDPLHGRVHYGDWTSLMTALLQRWVDETQQSKGNNDGRDSDGAADGDASRAD